MVVEHDDIDPALPQPGNGFDGSGAAIQGQEQRGGELSSAVFQAVQAQAVALVQAVREVRIDLPAQGLQDLHEQGGRSDAVHVVIAKNHHRLAALARLEQAVHGRRHVRQGKGVGQVFEPGPEEGTRRRRLAQPRFNRHCASRGEMLIFLANSPANSGCEGARDQ